MPAPATTERIVEPKQPERTGLEGRVALVTAGGRGIGRAIAQGLARDGADVGISYQRDREAADSCVESIRQLGRRACAFRASVEDFEADRALVDHTRRELGPVDILINNAGVDFRGAPVAETSSEELERAMRINALAAHALCRLVLPEMRERPRGDIVMLSSSVTEVMGADYAPYAMSKAALEALAVVLAKEERAHGIHVNVVAPGLVETDMGMRYVEALDSITDMRQVDPLMPFGRVCQPEEVADVVRYLVSPRSSYLSGQRIYVHGGGQ